MQAEHAGTWCEAQGWADRPTWADLVAGLRPPNLDVSATVLGEWKHGWQYYASDAAETRELDALKRAFAWPNTRSNAACRSKARLESCTGRFAAACMINAPTCESLTFTNVEIQISMWRRLGLAIPFEGPDTHGFKQLGHQQWCQVQCTPHVLALFLETGSLRSRRSFTRPKC